MSRVPFFFISFHVHVRNFLIDMKPEIIVAYDKLLMCYYKPHLIKITI